MSAILHERDDELAGRHALVTGSSRGIGRAIAVQLARRGADVAVNYRDDLGAAREAAKAIHALDRRAICLRADVTIEPEAMELVAHVTAACGRLDILVNNVGIFALGAVAETPSDGWQETLDSNLTSVYHLCRAVIPHMREAGGGCIINLGLAPMHLVRGAPNIAAYAIAKIGVSVLTRTLAVEEAPHGIRVNCVSPGLIDNGHLPPEQREWMQARVPSGRLGRPEEVAEAVAFLASERASYISGANLAVGGAWDWEDRPTAHDYMVGGVSRPKATRVGDVP